MKICILTQPLNFNYGGILQAYALQKVIREAGHYVVTDRFGAHQTLSVLERIARFSLHFYKRYLCGYKLYNPYRFLFCSVNMGGEYAKITIHTERFITKYIRCIDLFEGKSQPSTSVASEYDAFVVGSDQVWRWAYNFIPPYFLSFVQGNATKRISYAASFGLDNIEEFDKSTLLKCREWIALFDAVSVREESGVEICRRDLGVDAEWVLDPAMLLDAEDYLELIKPRHRDQRKKGLMNYILNESRQRDEIIDCVASTLSLTPLNIVPKGVFNRRSKDLNNSVLPSVEEWLLGIRNSEFVVTDSFHGVLFSIIFNTPFIAIENRDRGSARFYSLLKIFGLESRLISSSTQIDDKLFAPIDWQIINAKASEWRKKSLLFLNSSLGR